LFARINFLLGLGLLIQIVFYFAGTYLIVLPVSAIAPSWAAPAAGVAVLVAAGVTVQLLSMSMSELRGVALYANGERPGVWVFISQAAMILGHVLLVYAARALLLRGEPVSQMTLLYIAVVYGAGVAAGIQEWRQRKLART
jgi:FtsH-binding integral membrane protein